MSIKCNFRFPEMVSFITGLALAISVATQFRVSGVGPGEVLLVLVLFFSILSIVKKRKVQVDINHKAYFPIVVCCTFVSLVALAFSLHTGSYYEGWLRQYLFVAFPLIFPVVFSFAYGSYALNRVALFFSIFLILFYGAAYLLSILGVGGVGSVEFMYGSRFRGWSNNPNQAALAVGVAVPLLLLNIADRTAGGFFLLLLAFIGILVGLHTGSNALQVAWGLGLGFFLLKGDFMHEYFKFLGRHFFIIGTMLTNLVFFVVFFSGVFWLFHNYEVLYSGSGYGMSAGQGELRLTLWKNGYEAFLASPLIGHGPGHFSGIEGPFLGAEAHSFIFDWMPAYGILGGVAFFLYVTISGFKLVIKKDFPAFVVLLIILMVSMFHFFGRQPVFWFFLFYVGNRAFEVIPSKSAQTIMQRSGGRDE